MKILITGAHFTPAVAVIEQLRKYPDVKVVYVGRNSTQEGDSSPSQESQIIPKLGVSFISIMTGRMQRSFTVYTIPSLLKIPLGLLQSFYIILSQKPAVILSFGGYVAVPIIFVGWIFSVPIIIHEQTLVSGLTNKISSLFADKIAVSFEQRKLTQKTVVTGNPIRKQILAAQKIYHNKIPMVLISGGNQGSHALNMAVEDTLDKLIKIASVVHVTGDSKFDDFHRLEKRQTDRYQVKKWIGEEYGEVLRKVDLVVSRAGINTLTELAYIGKPALVIPFEPLYGDEQNKNAHFFEDLGLVRILPQSKLSGKSLLQNIKTMLSNLKYLKTEAKKAGKVIIPDAAKRLALETILLSGEN